MINTAVKTKISWKNKIGFFPTPENVLNLFTQYTGDRLIDEFQKDKRIKILDLFAGDGRIGKAMADYLEEAGYKLITTFVEIQSKEANKIQINSKRHVINTNVFEWFPREKFNLVVSNPPYYNLHLEDALKLGFTGKDINTCGSNLYMLGILKGLDLLEEGGILAVVSPFSWLRNDLSRNFREEIARKCSRVLIHASDKRTIFKGVNQDIGIQLFIKRTDKDIKNTQWFFGYNGYKVKNISVDILETRTNIKTYSRVSVGPIVWNRSLNQLGKRSKLCTLPLIYGGNICHDNKLDITRKKYKHKQYVYESRLRNSDIFYSPLILIRRIMRGIPGNWQIDSCLIEKPFKCAVENHVIAIQIPLGLVTSYMEFYEQLLTKIKAYYYFSGSPSISCNAVRKIVRNLEIAYIPEYVDCTSKDSALTT